MRIFFKEWKTEILILIFIVGFITFVVSFNFAYWSEMAPIYTKELMGKLPKESDGLKLPSLPDPFANNQTILGLDEDKNGIRDDIDYWIAINGINYNERMAIREKMKIEQKMLYYAEKKDFEGFQDAMRDLWVANGCHQYISSAYIENNDNRALLITLVEKILYNTEPRNSVMDKITSRGYLYEAPRGYDHPRNGKEHEYCTFEVENIPGLEKDYRKAIVREKIKWNYN